MPLRKESGCHIWRIMTDHVIVPDGYQRETGLPGDPRGDIRTGFARTRAELEDLAKADRTQGGSPVIERVAWSERHGEWLNA